MLRLIHKQTVNNEDLGSFTYSNDDERAAALRSVFEKIILDLSQHAPYSDKFNLGIDYSQATPTFPQNTNNDGTRNDSGMDFANLKPKINSLDMTGVTSVQKFMSLNLIGYAPLFTEYSTKVLGDMKFKQLNKFIKGPLLQLIPLESIFHYEETK